MCDKCKVPESVEHYLFDCDKYEEERKELEESVEDVLSRESINCSIIDLRVLSSNIEEISREGSFELVGALLKFIQCTKRFQKNFKPRMRTQSKIEYKYFEHFTEEKTAHGGDWQHI